MMQTMSMHLKKFAGQFQLSNEGDNPRKHNTTAIDEKRAAIINTNVFISRKRQIE